MISQQPPFIHDVVAWFLSACVIGFLLSRSRSCCPCIYLSACSSLYDAAWKIRSYNNMWCVFGWRGKAVMINFDWLSEFSIHIYPWMLLFFAMTTCNTYLYMIEKQLPMKIFWIWILCVAPSHGVGPEFDSRLEYFSEKNKNKRMNDVLSRCHRRHKVKKWRRRTLLLEVLFLPSTTTLLSCVYIIIFFPNSWPCFVSSISFFFFFLVGLLHHFWLMLKEPMGPIQLLLPRLVTWPMVLCHHRMNWECAFVPLVTPSIVVNKPPALVWIMFHVSSTPCNSNAMGRACLFDQTKSCVVDMSHNKGCLSLFLSYQQQNQHTIQHRLIR